MSDQLYIWISVRFHPERRGQTCTVEMPSMRGVKAKDAKGVKRIARFADGVGIEYERKHVRLATPASIAQYAPVVEGERTCRKCLVAKPLGEFQERRQGMGRAHVCRACRALGVSHEMLMNTSAELGIPVPDDDDCEDIGEII